MSKEKFINTASRIGKGLNTVLTASHNAPIKSRIEEIDEQIAKLEEEKAKLKEQLMEY